MPGMRVKTKDRAARRKRRLLFGLPLALAVAVGGGLAFADVAPQPAQVAGAAGAATTPTNGATPVISGMAPTAPTMMGSSTIAANISVSTVRLGTAFSYLSPSSTGIPQWTRTVTAVAPNG